MDPYRAMEPYGYDASLYQHAALYTPAGPRADSFARELLELYTKSPTAFDAYARDPRVRTALNIAESTADPFLASRPDYYDSRIHSR